MFAAFAVVEDSGGVGRWVGWLSLRGCVFGGRGCAQVAVSAGGFVWEMSGRCGWGAGLQTTRISLACTPTTRTLQTRTPTTRTSSPHPVPATPHLRADTSPAASAPLRAAGGARACLDPAGQGPQEEA